MLNAVRTIFTLRWQPGQDTAVAMATAVAMVPIYYLGTHMHGAIASVIFAVLGNGVLNVLLPAYYLLMVRREGAEELGITTRRLALAVGLSLVCSFIMWKGLQRELISHPGTDLLPHLVFNGIILWEPFFVYGWLQLRFERAFGLLPGILLAGICFGAYHLGTYPIPGVVGLAIFGMIFAILFRITKNLLTVWPLTWSICSSIGTLQGGFTFTWNQVALYAAILAVQLAAITWMICRKRDGKKE